MIGYLEGTIKIKEQNSLIIGVNGVGYRVFVPVFVYDNSVTEDKIEVFVYTHVRDDEITLFGFTNKIDQETFTNLISVSGIGPKLALNVLSHSKGSGKIIKAIQEADVDFFFTVKGLGKKSAQRIIIDLKPKLGSLQDLEFESDQDTDLVDALKELGFSREEIKKATKNIKKDLPIEEKIKLALKRSQ